MEKTVKRFNIRVYAIIERDDYLLLSDEYRFGRFFTKFPGGGVQPGEGLAEALKRECREEMHANIEIMDHFYTTDFLQLSAFNPEEQIIAVYYKVKIPDDLDFPCSDKALDIPPIEASQHFRWAGKAHCSTGDLDFPIDQKVMELLRSQ